MDDEKQHYVRKEPLMFALVSSTIGLCFFCMVMVGCLIASLL